MVTQVNFDEIELEVRQCFIQEDAPEYLTLLEEGVLYLNDNKGIIVQPPPPAWSAMLRAIHSLKGGAALAQLHQLSQLSHRIEDLLEALGDRRVQEIEVACHILMQSVDEIRNILEQAASGQLDPSSTILEIIQEILETGLTEPAEHHHTFVQDENHSLIQIVLESDFKDCLNRAESQIQSSSETEIKKILVDLFQETQALAEILKQSHLLKQIQQQHSRIEQTRSPSIETAREHLKQLEDARQACLQQPAGSPIQVAKEKDNPDRPSNPSSIAAKEPAPATTSPPTKPQTQLEAVPFQTASSSIPSGELTMRVPVRRLDEMVDAVGEMYITHAAWQLDQKRLRQTNSLMRNRSRQFIEIRDQIQSLYDQLLLPTRSLVAELSEHEGYDALEFDRFTELHGLLQDIQEFLARLEEESQDIDLQIQNQQETSERFRKQLDTMRHNLTESRMVPFSALAERFRRPLWDLNQRYGKSVRLRIKGGGTQIDRAVLDQLYEPLLHLLRNAYDHGIENPTQRQATGKPAEGEITLAAAQQGTQVAIVISDDGRGIDLDKVKARAQKLGIITSETEPTENQLLQCIFAPGFSTAQKIGELSGRGVGMEVVKVEIERLRGSIQIQTKAGRGTRFILFVPLTLNILPLLIVQRYPETGMPLTLGIPTAQILEMVEISSEGIEEDRIQWRDQSIPLIPLENLMANSPLASINNPSFRPPIAAILRVNRQTIALGINQLLSEKEMVLKPFDRLLPVPAHFVGCTITPSGQVIPVLGPEQLPTWLQSHQIKQIPQSRKPHLTPSTGSPPTQPEPSQPSPPQQAILNPNNITLMVIDDSMAARRWMSRMFEQAGYHVIQCRDGQDALEQLNNGVRCELAVCDIEMPRMDGFQLLQTVRQHSNPTISTIPIIMLTSRQGDRHRQQAQTLGANGYFIKPLGGQQILRSLTDLLSARFRAQGIQITLPGTTILRSRSTNNS